LALALLIACTVQAQQLFTAPLPHYQGAPTGAPSSQGSRVRYDLLSNDLYTWVSATSAWSLYSKGIDRISGTSAPMYTPNAGQSDWAVNGANPPELYYWTGLVWLRANPVSADAQTLSWNGANGELSISGSNTVDLDGRYLQSEVDGSVTNEIQTLSLVGRNLTLSSANTVTLPNDLQTLSQGATTVTLSQSGGTVNVDPSTTNEIQTLSLVGQELSLSSGGGSVTIPTVNINAGPGISVTGVPSDVTISNTGILDVVAGSDISVNIVDGVATVSATGGGVTWPLLAPNGDASAPSYSFENATETGVWLASKALKITSQSKGIDISAPEEINVAVTESVETGKSVSVFAGSGQTGGGNVTLQSGSDLSGTGIGGAFLLSSGAGGSGGNFVLAAGDATTGTGGGFTARAGNGGEVGGTFLLRSGDGTYQAGDFQMAAGNAPVDVSESFGGNFSIQGGAGIAGGNVGILGGPAFGAFYPGGSVSIEGGGAQVSDAIAGAVQLKGGSGGSAAAGANVYLVGGDCNTPELVGKIIVAGTGLVSPPVSSIVRDAIPTPSPGQVIWNTTATKLQVYTGSAWVDLH